MSSAQEIVERFAQRADRIIDAWEFEDAEGMTYAKIIAKEFSPFVKLIEAARSTIEFYDAHGGPMGDLRATLRELEAQK